MCCVVFEREKITTGTHSYKFRKVFLHKSKKFEKFDTQPTNAGARDIFYSSRGFFGEQHVVKATFKEIGLEGFFDRPEGR
jgi:hypothetical protein